MQIYLDLVVALNMAVDFLLLFGANRLTGYRTKTWKIGLASLIGGVYAGVCMMPGFSFLGNFFWRSAVLFSMAGIAFGFRRSALTRSALFVFLSMALGGIATAMGKGGMLAILLSGITLAVLCFLTRFGNRTHGQYAKVVLKNHGKEYQITALRDTGNTLSDPVTGRQVFVVGMQMGWETLGLTQSQLEHPIQTMEQHQELGLRLIPFRAVGKSSGMLLATVFDEVIVDGESVNAIVAFAPNAIGSVETYQGLTGGAY